MPNRRVEDYAYKHGLSFNEAKRRMGGRRKEDTLVEAIARGGPVTGTGKKGKDGGGGKKG